MARSRPSKGVIKVVITASASDDALLQTHHTTNKEKKDLERRFKDPTDPLKEALATYIAAKVRGSLTRDVQSEAMGVVKEQLQVARDLLHPIDWSGLREPKRAIALLPICLEHIYAQKDGEKRFCDIVLKLVRTFGLYCSTEEAIPLDEEVPFLRALRGLLIKGKGTGEDGNLGDGDGDGGNPKDVDLELRQLLSGALVAEGVTDVFQLAGLNKPDISILSDQFLAEISKIPQKNLALALLERLLKQKLRSRLKTNKVQQRRFSDMLQASLAKYANRSIDSAKVMEAMVSIAKEFQLELLKEQALGLSPAEVAFYDALAANASRQGADGRCCALHNGQRTCRQT